jgi:hypothetical protein
VCGRDELSSRIGRGSWGSARGRVLRGFEWEG